MALAAAPTRSEQRNHSRPDAPRTDYRRQGIPGVQGHVSPGFEAVREAFVENFARTARTRRRLLRLSPRREGRRSVGRYPEQADRRAVGAGHHGHRLLGHQGSGRDDDGARALPRLARLRGAGLPRTGRSSRSRARSTITVRQLLAHQAGLFALDEPRRSEPGRRPRSTGGRAGPSEAAWEPGTRQAYHAITLGFYEGELLRRVDPRHRSLGQFFQDEIATPLGLDVYIRLPESIPNARLATHRAAQFIEMLRGFGPRFMLEAMNPSLQHHPGAQGLRAAARRRARLRAQPRSAVRRRRSARRAPSRTPTASSRPADGSWAAPGDAGLAGGAGDSADARLPR